MGALKKIFGFSFLLLLLIIIFNYFIDSTGRYHNSKKNNFELNNILKSHVKVSTIVTINSFSYKSDLIKKTNSVIDTIICGTSKTLNIGDLILPNQNYLNLSGNGYSFLDVMFLCEFAIDKFKPNKIIFSVEPYMFHSINPSNEWLRLSNETFFKNTANLYDVQNDIFDKFSFYKQYFTNLLNYKIFKKNILYLQTKKELKNKFILDNSEFETLNDSGVFMETYYNFGVVKDNKISVYDNYDYIKSLAITSMKRKSKFLDKSKTQLYRFAKKNSKTSELIFIKIPFHPIYYNEEKKRFKYDEIDFFIDQLSSELNISVKGDYNFLSTKCLAEEMLDAMHILESCTKKIFN